MALNRKYANLPDLDNAPDIYETPELTEDNSTIPGTARSTSSVSDYHDFDDESEAGISRSRLQPDEARIIFSPAQIDARDVDFSDRVSGKRKSYKASSRRQRQREDGTTELGDLSDEDDGENLERKLARLRREVEEVKEEVNRRKAAKQQEGAEATESPVSYDDAAALSKVLDGLSTSEQKDAGLRARSQLARALQTGLLKTPTPTPSQPADATTYTLTYSPAFDQNHALAKAADFDTRLAMLEKILGINSTVVPALDANGNPRPVLPTLDRLHRQIGALADSSASSLDTISRRVHTLTQEATRLEEARRSAKEAHEAFKSASSDMDAPMTRTDITEDDEQVAKINALYGLLPTVEKLSPLLPSLLDRLRSLRTIHADAATASQNLDKVEQQQADMVTDIQKWRDGLAKVEEAMQRGETTMNGNVKVVEGWVKDLEERLRKTGA